MENFDLLYSLFNQFLFTEAKNNISSLKYYFETNPNTSGNPLIENMLQAIRDYDLDAIGHPLFQSILMKCGKTDSESRTIMSEIIKWKNYTKEQIRPAKEYLGQICAKVELDKAGRLYSTSPLDYIKYIKNLNLKTEDLDMFSTISFGNVDINTIVAEAGTGFIPSQYDWINDTFKPYPGYEKGQIVIVCAPPATGKSLFMMSEALHMAATGYKVLYVGLGDNKMKDFIVRLGAMYTGLSFGEVVQNLGNVYDSLKDVIQDRLEISINPAGKISPEMIIEKIKEDPDRFDVIIIDYDSNLKGVSEGDNMYNSFGVAYEKLTELSLMNKLVFVGSQTKVTSWKNEVVELTDVGESSRKQHSADMIIGIGKNVDCPNHVHCINISKSRRGEIDVRSYCIRLGNGRFYPICRDLYEELKRESEKTNYTESQIKAMNDAKLKMRGSINNYNNQVQQRVMNNQPQSGPINPIGNNPFI